MITDKIIEALRNDLQTGQYDKSGRIPSFRNLAKRYECSLGSIKSAVDRLQRERLLYSIHGKGTFIVGVAPCGAHIKRNRVIGAIVLDDGAGLEFERQKEMFLNLGWFLAVYNASDDHQAPERERNFLRMAEAEGFTAIIMVATPLEPLNTSFFMKLRIEGMKIAHLSPYKDDMSSETYFSPDWRAAGRLAASEAAMRGYQQIVYVYSGKLMPFKQLQLEGIAEMTDGPEFKQLPSIVFNDADKMKDLPTNTAFICASSWIGNKMCKKIASFSHNVPEEFGIASLSEDIYDENKNDKGSIITFDNKAQITAALDYTTDEKINSLERIQILFAPSFKDGNTLRPKPH